MPNTELIFFESRADLVAALSGLNADPSALAVDIIHPGTTLRVRRVDGYPIGEEFGPEEETSEGESHPEPGSETPEGTPAPVEAPEGESGAATASEEPEPEPEEGEEEGIDLDTATRAQLREIVADYALDVEIPDHGPLAHIREAVSAALD